MWLGGPASEGHKIPRRQDTPRNHSLPHTPESITQRDLEPRGHQRLSPLWNPLGMDGPGLRVIHAVLRVWPMQDGSEQWPQDAACVQGLF